MDVLHLDNHLFVVAKPAGLLTQSDKTGDVDLLTMGKQYLKERFQKPGQVFLGLVHRLDRPVSGVVVLARTSKSASRLSQQFRDRTVVKRYVAIVEGRVPEKGTIENHVLKRDGKSKIVKPGSKGSKFASLSYEPLLILGWRTLLLIGLTTGRSHQIRVQLAAAGHPVVGDRKYGAKTNTGTAAVALHCLTIGIEHPTLKEPRSWSAPVPRTWPSEFRDRATEEMDS